MEPRWSRRLLSRHASAAAWEVNFLLFLSHPFSSHTSQAGVVESGGIPAHHAERDGMKFRSACHRVEQTAASHQLRGHGRRCLPRRSDPQLLQWHGANGHPLLSNDAWPSRDKHFCGHPPDRADFCGFWSPGQEQQTTAKGKWGHDMFYASGQVCCSFAALPLNAENFAMFSFWPNNRHCWYASFASSFSSRALEQGGRVDIKTDVLVP
jgi:hypothetical protein